MNSMHLNCTTHSFPPSPLSSPTGSLQAPFCSFVSNHRVQFMLPYECGCGDFLWDIGDCQHRIPNDKWLQLEHMSWNSNLGLGTAPHFVALDMWILTQEHTHQLFLLYLSIQSWNSVSHICTANSILPAELPLQLLYCVWTNFISVFLTLMLWIIVLSSICWPFI